MKVVIKAKWTLYIDIARNYLANFFPWLFERRC